MVAQIIKNDIANGKGIRLSIFISGCRRNCKGCFNKEAQDFNYGIDNDKAFKIISKELEENINNYDGITLLGGEPLEPENKEFALELAKYAKKLKLNVWLYTGYLYEEIKDLEILNYVDVLVDGPFIEEQKDLTLAFRGSKNQRIIDNKTESKNILNFDKKEEKND